MRRLLALIAACLLFALLPGSAGAITKRTEGHRRPVSPSSACSLSTTPKVSTCTGAPAPSLSRTVVLTAAHCTEGTAKAYAYFSVDPPVDFRGEPDRRPWHDVHPSRSSRTKCLRNDVGVVVLDGDGFVNPSG